MQTDITRFAFDMCDECIGILELGKITQDVLDTHIERFLQGWDFIDHRNTNRLIFDSETGILLHDTDDEDSLRGYLEAIMELLLSTISDHTTINSDEFFGHIFIRLTDMLFAKFEDLPILHHDHFILRITEIIGITSIASEHMSESIDRDIVFWRNEGDHLLRIFLLRMSSCMDL